MPLAGPSAQASPPVNRPGGWSAAFVGLLLAWVLLNGLEFLVVGVLTAAVAALVPALLAQSWLPRLRPLRALGFAGYFVLESFRGGADVAGRALRPSLPIEPGFFRHRTSLPPGLPQGLLMGTLSLPPGTLSVDMEEDGRTLVLHSLVGDATAEARGLGAPIARLFHPTAP